ncbi:MAG: protease inhibitor I9 family protein [Methylocystis sp.]|nr:protease inhibitor I9 family protein [Methylocystis sp.]
MKATRRGALAAFFALLTPARAFAGWRETARQSYIVVLNDDADAARSAESLGRRYGFAPAHIFTGVNGFSAALTPEAAQALRGDPSVRSVEIDRLSRPLGGPGGGVRRPM